MNTLWDYIVDLGRRMSDRALSDIQTIEDWEAVRDERRREFLEMVGLDPLPERTPLNPQIHGTTRGDGYTIERLAIESLPSVFVLINLYIPDGLDEPAPGVLYVCGHGMIGTEHYQAQADLWARRGYVFLALDTLEQGDSRGDHHGIYYEDDYHWVDRGYASSGGELWNSLRALDYLCSRQEVDADRIGVTGISGGGALSWWVGIVDERVKAIAPVCGTSTMASHLAERTLNGHCDCMLYHNLYEREMSEVGALCAPRPLLVGCASEDPLFYPPAYRLVVDQVRKVYELYGKPELCELCEYPGPHSYSKKVHDEIQLLFDRHVAGWEKPVIDIEEKKFEESDLTVFGGAPPAEDRISLMPILLSTPGQTPHADSIDDWESIRKQKVEELNTKVFLHFPSDPEPLDVSTAGDWDYGGGTRLLVRDFTTEDGIRLRLRITVPEEQTGTVLVGLMGAGDRFESFHGNVSGVAGGHAACTVEARGTGKTSVHPNQEWQLLRGALLVGRTVAGLQVYDLLRAIELVRGLDEVDSDRIFTYGTGEQGVLAIYAAVLDEQVDGVLADSPTATHVKGPHLLNVLRVVDIPEAAGLVAPRPIGLIGGSLRPFHWTRRLYDRLGIGERLVMGSTAREAFQKISVFSDR